jgi:hypothetical protein
MADLVLNSPVRSCCGNPAGRCRCKTTRNRKARTAEERQQVIYNSRCRGLVHNEVDQVVGNVAGAVRSALRHDPNDILPPSPNYLTNLAGGQPFSGTSLRGWSEYPYDLSMQNGLPPPTMNAILRNRGEGMSAEDHTADSDSLDDMAARAKANGHDDIARMLMQASGAHRRESVRKQADDMEGEMEGKDEDDDQDDDQDRNGNGGNDRRQTRNMSEDEEDRFCDPDSPDYDEDRCDELRSMSDNRLYTGQRRFIGGPRSKASGGLRPRGVVSNLAPSRKLVAHLRSVRNGTSDTADVSRDNFGSSGDCGQDFGDRYSAQREPKQRPSGKRGDMTYDLPRQDPSTSDQYSGYWVPSRRDTDQDEQERQAVEEENRRRLRLGSMGERDLGLRPSADDLADEPPTGGPSAGRSPLHRNARSSDAPLVPPSSDFASLSLQHAGPGRDKWAAFIRHR